MESALEVGIVQDHRHSGVYKDEGAHIQEGREAAQKPRYELATEEDDRNREQQTEDEQAEITVRRAGDRQDVVEAHDDVGEDDRLNRLSQCAGFLDVAVFTAVGPQELERDVEEEDTADGLQVRNTQE